jgi:hypothetical protein
MFTIPSTNASSADIELTPEELAQVNEGEDTFGKSGFGTPIAVLGLLDESDDPASDVGSERFYFLEWEPQSYVLTRNADGSFEMVGVFAPTELIELDALRADIERMPETVRRPVVPLASVG